MTNTQLNLPREVKMFIRDALKEWRENLGEKIEKLSLIQKEEIKNQADLQERDSIDATVFSSLALKKHLINDYLERFSRSQKALYRLDVGTWGICEDCGLPMAASRLCDDPTVSRCVECEKKWKVVSLFS